MFVSIVLGLSFEKFGHYNWAFPTAIQEVGEVLVLSVAERECGSHLRFYTSIKSLFLGCVQLRHVTTLSKRKVTGAYFVLWLGTFLLKWHEFFS